tara:strand:+ start:47746 stop:49779 length:2034 start_codon:yes stop_codon:yes gene_type:complete
MERFNMLNKLSRKAFTPFGVKEVNLIKNLHRNPLFLFGLFLKIFLVFYSYPLIHSNLFIPFISNSLLNLSNDPWNSFVNSGGDIKSFPYGISMFFTYLPLSSIGFLLDKFWQDYNFFEFGFKITSFLFDYISLILLSLITKQFSNKILLFSYWLSPIVIYTTYIHGQLDIVPVTFLLACICMISWNRYKSAGIFISLAIFSKLSMLIALPFILIYLHRRKGFNYELFKFILLIIICILFLFIPFIFSEGFWTMVLKTREIERLYYVFIPFGSNLKLYVVPVIYFLSLYLVWRLKRITQDLFLIATGLGFFSILIFIPAAPGWYVWILPFLTFYQIKSKKDFITLGLIYNIFTILEIYLFSKGSFFKIPFFEGSFYLGQSISPLKGTHFNNLIFTFQKSVSILLAIRMYFYGLRRNNFYSISSKPILISISGNENEIINKFANSLIKLIPQKNLNLLTASKCINNLERNNKYLHIKNDYMAPGNSQNKKNKPYFASQISEGLQFLNKLIDNNEKDYLVLLNDIDVTQGIISEKIDLKININKNSDGVSNFPFSNKNFNSSNLSFDFCAVGNSISTDYKNYSLTAFLPLGFLHANLLRLSISVASLNVDTEVSKDNEWVKMTIEGDPTSEDISHMAQSIIPEIDDFSLKEDSWSSGYCGIMQIILLANISQLLKKNRNF